MANGDLSYRWPASVATAYGASGGPYRTYFVKPNAPNTAKGQYGSDLDKMHQQYWKNYKGMHQEVPVGANGLLPNEYPKYDSKTGQPTGEYSGAYPKYSWTTSMAIGSGANNYHTYDPAQIDLQMAQRNTGFSYFDPKELMQ